MPSPIKRPKQAPSFKTGINVPDGTAIVDAMTENKNLKENYNFEFVQPIIDQKLTV